MEFLRGRVSPVCSLGLLVSYDSAVGPSAQARDTALLGEEEHAGSTLRKSDYLEKEKMVLLL